MRSIIPARGTKYHAFDVITAPRCAARRREADAGPLILPSLAASARRNLVDSAGRRAGAPIDRNPTHHFQPLGDIA